MDVAGKTAPFPSALQACRLPSLGGAAPKHPTAASLLRLRANKPRRPARCPAAVRPHLAVNMSRIESRPSKREMGEYLFFVGPGATKRFGLPEQAVAEIGGSLFRHWFLFGTYTNQHSS